jgi:hypothetical protein
MINIVLICTGARGTDHPPFSNFLFTNLFSIKFLYFFIISSLFPYFNLFVSIFIQSYVNIKLHVSTLYRIHKACNSAGLKIGSEKFQKLKLYFWNFSDHFVEVNAVVRHFRQLCVGNKCELSYAQNKNRGNKMCILEMDTCPSLNDIMEIRCNKCTRSEQGYDF